MESFDEKHPKKTSNICDNNFLVHHQI